MRFEVSKKTGFTLVEMLVVIAVFSIIMGIALSIFISAVRMQKYSLVSQCLLDQTSYAVEYMARFLRMAKKDMDGNCLSALKRNYDIIDPIDSQTGYGVKFEDYQGACRSFYLENSQLKDYYQGRSPNEVLDLTSDDVEITNFRIRISGQSQDDNYQPRVTIFLEAEGKGVVPRPKIRLQVTVSQRDIDIPE